MTAEQAIVQLGFEEAAKKVVAFLLTVCEKLARNNGAGGQQAVRVWRLGGTSNANGASFSILDLKPVGIDLIVGAIRYIQKNPACGLCVDLGGNATDESLPTVISEMIGWREDNGNKSYPDGTIDIRLSSVGKMGSAGGKVKPSWLTCLGDEFKFIKIIPVQFNAPADDPTSQATPAVKKQKR